LGVNAETTVFVSNEGDIDLSMPPLNEAVFVAEIEGNLLSAQDKFDVLVNGQRQGIVARGSRAIISLTPYREYSISLSAQEGSSLVDYDVAKYKVTLFPGNVAKRVWSVDKVFVLLGRVIDEEGQPIVRERIKGAKGYGFTEADGTFQLEVSGREPLSIESPRRRCTIDVTMDEVPEYVLDVGDVVCRSEE
jgi:outer membrane usher protein FimD/PapC